MADEQPQSMGTRVAYLERWVRDLDSRVGAMTPMITTVATLSERVNTIREDFADFRKLIDQRDAETRQERRTFTRWAITLTVTIMAALITATAAIVSAGVFH